MLFPKCDFFSNFVFFILSIISHCYIVRGFFKVPCVTSIFIYIFVDFIICENVCYQKEIFLDTLYL